MNAKRLETWESIFRNVMFSIYLKFRTMYKIQKPSDYECQLVLREIFLLVEKCHMVKV
jgi:hypothetical protein